MDIIGKRHIFLGFSGLLITTSIIAMVVYGLRPGIDFVGGTLWQIGLTTSAEGGSASGGNDQPFDATQGGRQTTGELRDFFVNQLGVRDATIFPSENNRFLVRFGHIPEQDHARYASLLKEKFSGFEEIRFETIGPTIGSEIKRKAYIAIVLVLLGISFYIAFAFRKVSQPIRSWKYGFVTLLTLFHDIIIPTGLVAILGHYAGVEVDTNFVVALLVVMGFSVHDTIVVFDRIRENLLVHRDRSDLRFIINLSINQTLARSINTSLTLIFVLLSLFFFGPVTLKYFVLTIMTGTIIGTYSSIFIASPALLFAPLQERHGRPAPPK
ncbi:protein translocase subunit SecF [Candidatus Wolfebacteria bacterium]|nr:protein translocase subunit SecF [Candidatus Wolfebacteria bacterium]